MGCSGSKADDLPLVVRCRERRDLIRAAANHRYALAAAHVSYFRSLKDIGDALRAFVDEELITTSASSSSSFSSPSLILPPNSKAKHSNHNHDDEDLDEDDVESHLHLSDSSSEEDTPHLRSVHKGLDNEGGSRYNGYRPGFGEGMVNNDGESRYNGYGQRFGEGMFNNEGNSRYNGYTQGFGERVVNNGGESRYNGYRQGFGEGMVNDPFTYPYPYSYPQQAPTYGQQYMDPWNYTGNSNMHFMKKSAPATRTVVQQPPVEPGHGYSDSYWTSPPGYGYYPTGNSGAVKVSPPKEPPPPPSPQASAWDFFNPFDGIGGGYSGYYSGGGYGYGSNYSSPDSTEVREREGIPDLEEETENEIYKEVVKGKIMNSGKMNSAESTPRSRAPPPVHRNSAGVSRSVPMHKSESSSKTLSSWSSAESEKPSMPPQYKMETEMPSQYNRSGEKQSMPPQHKEETVNPSMAPGYGQEGEVPSRSPPHLNGEMSSSISLTEEKSSSEHIISTSTDDGSVKKKGVTFDVEGTSKLDGESPKLSSFTLLSPNGNRDLREVVVEIKDEFEIASCYGKEVAMMLEVGKLPYQPGFLKVLISRVMYLVSPSLSYRDAPSLQSAKLASKTMKLVRSYFEDVGKDVNAKACNLSAVLDKLYVWEKKLYKEVKDEERLRISYEKQCKRLKMLDQEGTFKDISTRNIAVDFRTPPSTFEATETTPTARERKRRCYSRKEIASLSTGTKA